MMTDDELVERVARAICAETGKSPDEELRSNKLETVREGSAFVQRYVTRPRWHEFREEARKHIAAWKVLRAALPMPYPEEVMPELPLTPD